MSVDWEFTFSALGPNDLVEKLHSSLKDISWSEHRGDDKPPKPKLFYHIMIVSRSYGLLVAEVERNFYGANAIEDMAEQFAGLTFQGSGGVSPYFENFYLFESRDGVTTWRKIDMLQEEAELESDFDPDFDPDKAFTLEDKARIERMISESQQRLAREQSLLVGHQNYLKQREQKLDKEAATAMRS